MTYEAENHSTDFVQFIVAIPKGILVNVAKIKCKVQVRFRFSN